MPEVSAQWAELDVKAKEAFAIGFSNKGRRASMIPEVFGKESSDGAYEEFIGTGVLGSDGWNLEASGRVQYDEVKKGFEKRFTHVEYAKGVTATRTMIDDGKLSKVINASKALGDSAYRKREKGAASVFTNAFTDSGTNVDGHPIAGPDAVGLCSTAHPRSAEDSTTQSNEGTLALTTSNLSATRLLHSKITDDRGDLMDIMPDELLVPPELGETAAKIVGSNLDPDSANNAINPQAGRFKIKEWHYLTDANAWFTIDSARRDDSLKWFDRIPLEFAMEGDFDTFMAKWAAYMRYSYGWIDWSWVYGQNPS